MSCAHVCAQVYVRADIVKNAGSVLAKAVTIATRYAAVRRQTAPAAGQPETQVGARCSAAAAFVCSPAGQGPSLCLPRVPSAPPLLCAVCGLCVVCVWSSMKAVRRGLLRPSTHMSGQAQCRAARVCAAQPLVQPLLLLHRHMQAEAGWQGVWSLLGQATSLLSGPCYSSTGTCLQAGLQGKCRLLGPSGHDGAQPTKLLT